MNRDYVYLFIIGVLFIIDSEYNFQISEYNLRHLLKYDIEHEFILEDRPSFHFKRGRFRFKSKDRVQVFRIMNTKRKRIDKMLIKVFGKEKYNDMKSKSDLELIQKYGKEIKNDIEIMNIFLENYDTYKFQKVKKKIF